MLIRATLIALFLSFQAQAQSTTRASVATGGAQANDSSDTSATSSGGRYTVFESLAQLSPNDTMLNTDIYRHDRQTNTTVLVSVNMSGGTSASGNFAPDITPDGRYVVWSSPNNDLVAGDTGFFDVFVRDMNTGTTTMVSTSSSGIHGNQDSVEPAISDDGRYVAFTSRATNLVANDNNGKMDVFVKDRSTGVTVRASVDSSGNEGNGNSVDIGSDYLAISGNGRYVAFSSVATNLVANDTNGLSDLFVHDLQTGATVRASVSFSGGNSNGQSANPSLSYDGRFVAFASDATNLIMNDTTSGATDIWVRDLQLGTTICASRTWNGQQAIGASYAPTISNDGRYVAFRSDGQLVPADLNFGSDIYVRDLLAGTTSLISVNTAGNLANAISERPSISPDGSYVTFDSFATNLVANDTNATEDIFLRNRGNFPGWLPYCFGDGTGTACPCANFTPPGNGEGCLHSQGSGGKLAATGNANYITDTFVLQGSQMPNSTCLYFQGTVPANGGLGFVLGDGLICVGGTVIRLGTETNLAGYSQYPGFGDPLISVKGQITGAFTRYYQIWYRDNVASWCPTYNYNFTNAIEVTWGPCIICP